MGCFTKRNVMRFLAVFLSICCLFACSNGGDSPPPPAAAGAAAVKVLPPADITADSGKQRVILNWSNVLSATSFTVYWGTSPGVTKANAKIEDAHSPYIMRTLSDGTTPLTNDGTPYYFAVATVSGGVESELSAEVSAVPSATPPPTSPVNIRAEAGNGQVRISWDPSSGASTYTVYYKASPHVTKADGIAVPNAGSPRIVAPLTNGTTYYFVVTASSANESALSFEVNATPVASPPPAVPKGVTAVEGDGQVTLTWNPVAGAGSYNIYYGTEYMVNKVNGTKVSGVTVTSPYVMAPLANKKAYFFVVTAANLNGESAESDQVSATPLAAKPGSALILVPAGPFQMGDNLSDAGALAPYSLPVHTVNLSDFYIDRYETTYDLWKTVYDWAVDPVRGAQRYAFDSAGQRGSFGIGTNMPVTVVSWWDVVKWLNARSEMESRTPVYYTDATQATVYRTGSLDLPAAAVNWSANGYRLPTDAEWEKASRGGLVGKRYPWGDVLDASYANYNMGGSTSVGVYPPNDYGLYDMAGNVWEWTWDWNSADYSWAPDGITDPHGPAAGTLRVRRGGSYTYGSRYLRCFERMFRMPIYSGPYFGFRSASSQP
jgi:formylglycine-generating enzyme required for sulfatase activity